MDDETLFYSQRLFTIIRNLRDKRRRSSSPQAVSYPHLTSSSCQPLSRENDLETDFLKDLCCIPRSHPVLNKRDREGFTLIQHAAAADSPRIIRALHSRGAVVRTSEKTCSPPAHIACKLGNIAAYCAFLQLGIDEHETCSCVCYPNSHDGVLSSDQTEASNVKAVDVDSDLSNTQTSRNDEPFDFTFEEDDYDYPSFDDTSDSPADSERSEPETPINESAQPEASGTESASASASCNSATENNTSRSVLSFDSTAAPASSTCADSTPTSTALTSTCALPSTSAPLPVTSFAARPAETEGEAEAGAAPHSAVASATASSTRSSAAASLSLSPTADCTRPKHARVALTVAHSPPRATHEELVQTGVRLAGLLDAPLCYHLDSLPPLVHPRHYAIANNHVAFVELYSIYEQEHDLVKLIEIAIAYGSKESLVSLVVRLRDRQRLDPDILKTLYESAILAGVSVVRLLRELHVPAPREVHNVCTQAEILAHAIVNCYCPQRFALDLDVLLDELFDVNEDWRPLNLPELVIAHVHRWSAGDRSAALKGISDCHQMLNLNRSLPQCSYLASVTSSSIGEHLELSHFLSHLLRCYQILSNRIGFGDADVQFTGGERSSALHFEMRVRALSVMQQNPSAFTGPGVSLATLLWCSLFGLVSPNADQSASTKPQPSMSVVMQRSILDLASYLQSIGSDLHLEPIINIATIIKTSCTSVADAWLKLLQKNNNSSALAVEVKRVSAVIDSLLAVELLPFNCPESEQNAEDYEYMQQQQASLVEVLVGHCVDNLLHTLLGSQLPRETREKLVEPLLAHVWYLACGPMDGFQSLNFGEFISEYLLPDERVTGRDVAEPIRPELICATGQQLKRLASCVRISKMRLLRKAFRVCQLHGIYIVQLARRSRRLGESCGLDRRLTGSLGIDSSSSQRPTFQSHVQELFTSNLTQRTLDAAQLVAEAIAFAASSVRVLPNWMLASESTAQETILSGTATELVHALANREGVEPSADFLLQHFTDSALPVALLALVELRLEFTSHTQFAAFLLRAAVTFAVLRFWIAKRPDGLELPRQFVNISTLRFPHSPRRVQLPEASAAAAAAAASSNLDRSSSQQPSGPQLTLCEHLINLRTEEALEFQRRERQQLQQQQQQVGEILQQHQIQAHNIDQVFIENVPPANFIGVFIHNQHLNILPHHLRQRVRIERELSSEIRRPVTCLVHLLRNSPERRLVDRCREHILSQLLARIAPVVPRVNEPAANAAGGELESSANRNPKAAASGTRISDSISTPSQVDVQSSESSTSTATNTPTAPSTTLSSNSHALSPSFGDSSSIFPVSSAPVTSTICSVKTAQLSNNSVSLEIPANLKALLAPDLSLTTGTNSADNSTRVSESSLQPGTAGPSGIDGPPSTSGTSGVGAAPFAAGAFSGGEGGGASTSRSSEVHRTEAEGSARSLFLDSSDSDDEPNTSVSSYRLLGRPFAMPLAPAPRRNPFLLLVNRDSDDEDELILRRHVNFVQEFRTVENDIFFNDHTNAAGRFLATSELRSVFDSTTADASVFSPSHNLELLHLPRTSASPAADASSQLPPVPTNARRPFLSFGQLQPNEQLDPMPQPSATLEGAQLPEPLSTGSQSQSHQHSSSPSAPLTAAAANSSSSDQPASSTSGQPSSSSSSYKTARSAAPSSDRVTAPRGAFVRVRHADPLVPALQVDLSVAEIVRGELSSAAQLLLGLKPN